MASASFWGLKLSKGLQFTKVAEKSFHVSSATLDPSSTTEHDVLSVIFEEDDQEYILCNLSLKHGILQVPLDLQFSEGDNITFSLRGGKGNVYLTGYNIFDEDFENMMDSDEDEEGGEDECNEELETLSIPSPVQAKRKRKSIEDGSSKSPKLDVKRLKTESDVLSSSKKKKNLNKSTNSQSDEGNKKSALEKAKTSVENGGLVSKSLAALLANGDMEEDEEDDDFLVGEEGEEDGEEVDEEEEEEEDDDDEEEEDDDDEEDEEEEEEDDEEEDDEEEMETESPAKKSPQIVHSPGKTPIVKGNLKQQKKKKNLNDSIKKTPNREQEQSVETPKSKKKKQNLLTPKDAENKSPKPSKDLKTPISGKKPVAQKTPQSAGKKEVKSGGVIVEDLVIGNGVGAKQGKMMAMYYEGKLKNGKTFDKTVSGPPFKFRLGFNEVIKGWDVGVLGMRVGGKRKIIVPPSMGYGKKGAPPSIPPNSLLVFEVELKGVS